MFSLYVGNLNFTVTESDLREKISPLGEVSSINIILDKETGKSRGFGVIEMDDKEVMRKILELNGTIFKERVLRVYESKRSNKSMHSCSLCTEDRDLVDFRGTKFCRSCILKLSKLLHNTPGTYSNSGTRNYNR